MEGYLEEREQSGVLGVRMCVPREWFEGKFLKVVSLVIALGSVNAPPPRLCIELYMFMHFSGKGVHHFYHIFKGVLDPKEI